MRPLYIFIILTLCLDTPANSYAAYVGDSFRLFSTQDKKRPYAIYIDGITDMVYDRNAKHETDDMKVDFYGASAGLVLKNIIVLYAGMGSARVEEEYDTDGRRTKWESDYGFTWLTGGVFKLYEKSLKNFYNSNLLIDLDVQYRNTAIDADKITIDSIQYAPSDPTISYSSMEYNDWHVALTCGLDIGPAKPYVGVKYSDFESCVNVMQNGVVYQKNNAEAAENFGIFGGINFKFFNSFCAGVEAGVIDENYISASLSWRF